MNPRAAKPLLLAALVLVVAVFPWLLNSSYWMNLVNLAISFSVACLGLNIVLGYAGQTASFSMGIAITGAVIVVGSSATLLVKLLTDLEEGC